MDAERLSRVTAELGCEEIVADLGTEAGLAAVAERDIGIRCNAIAPGAIQTKMQVRQPPHPGGMQAYAPYFPTIPPQGKAAEVADVAAFLVSDGARCVNGEVVSVDGGWTAY